MAVHRPSFRRLENRRGEAIRAILVSTKMTRRIASVLFALVSAARADMSYRDYHEHKDDRVTEFYLVGVGHGLGSANLRLQFKKQARLYCPPENLGLELSNFQRILDDTANALQGQMSQARIDAFSVDELLLQGLINTFPCEATKQDK